jgi:hypothetical protein
MNALGTTTIKDNNNIDFVDLDFEEQQQQPIRDEIKNTPTNTLLAGMVFSSTEFKNKCKTILSDNAILSDTGLGDLIFRTKMEVEDISKTIQENMTKSVEFLHDAEGKFESIIKEIDKIKKSDTLAKIALRKLIATGWKPEDGTVEQ